MPHYTNTYLCSLITANTKRKMNICSIFISKQAPLPCRAVIHHGFLLQSPKSLYPICTHTGASVSLLPKEDADSLCCLTPDLHYTNEGGVPSPRLGLKIFEGTKAQFSVFPIRTYLFSSNMLTMNDLNKNCVLLFIFFLQGSSIWKLHYQQEPFNLKDNGILECSLS